MRNLSFSRWPAKPGAGLLFALVIGALILPKSAWAEEAAPSMPESAAAAENSSVSDDSPENAKLNLSPEVAALYADYGAYCEAIVDEARERRYALKRAEIEKLIEDLKSRVAEAEAKSDALEKWVKRREEFARQANEKVVEIYANMRPEASAARLEQLDINLAASLLLAIPPRQASPILNEMDEKNAALITSVMAASGRKDDPS